MPTYGELHERIQSIVDVYGGKLPVEHALIWEGYLSALMEWQLLSVADHAALLAMLGPTPASPGLMISLGPEGAKDTMAREGLTDLVSTPHG